jgi:hypothetical protein
MTAFTQGLVLQNLLDRAQMLRAVLLRVQLSRALAGRSMGLAAVLAVAFSVGALAQTAAPPQTAPQTAAPLSGSVAAADFTGRWEGSFDLTPQGGEMQHDSALMIVKQDGGALTGSAGRDDDHLFAVKEGKVIGGEIQFALEEQDGVDVQVRLHLEGDHLVGEATHTTPDGSFTAKIDLVRVKR